MNQFIQKGCEIIQIAPRQRLITTFTKPAMKEGLAGDYLAFASDKYFDKDINQEWPPIDKRARIQYNLSQARRYLEQAQIIAGSKHLRWNDHGNEVIG